MILEIIGCMESSSNDSFLWTEASNDSDDNKENKRGKLMEAYYEGERESGANFKQNERDTNLASDNEIEPKKKRQKSKKSKSSEATQENSDYSQSERKRIKSEPESDIDIGKIRNLNEKLVDNNVAQDFNLHAEEYLNLRVKQEQVSFVQSKKRKKHKRSNSNSYNACDSDCDMEENRKSYLDLQVKREQASVVEPEIVKSKKKKKQTQSVASLNVDIAGKTMSMTKLSEATDQDSSPAIGEQTEYSIIEEKFIAEETVVEKSRKKKHKKEEVTKSNSDYDNNSIDVEKKIGIFLEADGDNTNNNDMSLEPSFSCNNIVSSTVINSSAIDLRDKQLNKKAELLRSKSAYTTKISDRIRFEDDNNSNHQESLLGKTSAKINMYLKENPHLGLFAQEITKDSMITNNDEIWTLTLPHGINCEKFRNTTISSEGKCKIKVEGQTYEGVLNEDVITITLLTHQHGQPFITNLPVNNCINYHKRIPKVHIPGYNNMINNQTNFTPLPETKCRHPLFGAHYKKVIKISTAVSERLQAAKRQYSENSSETINKKKRKKNQHKSESVKMEEDSVRIKPECEPLKKKKKRKYSQDDNDPPKKRKRLKHNADSSEVWESEKAIEENLFNF